MAVINLFSALSYHTEGGAVHHAPVFGGQWEGFSFRQAACNTLRRFRAVARLAQHVMWNNSK
jgi:hypothetical protein